MKAALSSAQKMTHQNIPTSVKAKLESHVGRKFPLLTIASVVGMVPDRKKFRVFTQQ